MLFEFPKKEKNNFIQNYHPVSLLPIFGTKIWTTDIEFSFKYIDENELLNPNQSGFCLFDFCVNQLLSINHEIF